MCFPHPTTHIAEADANHHNPSQMLSTQRRQSPPSTQIHARMNIPYLTLSRPLSPSELQVLRAQYEKEGDMVGVQTKFNYAWVRPMPPHILVFPRHTCCCFSLSPFHSLPYTRLGFRLHIAHHLSIGPRQIKQSQRPTTRRPPPQRYIPSLSRTSPRMPVLPRPRKLQARKLRRGPPLQRPPARQGAREPPGFRSTPTD